LADAKARCKEGIVQVMLQTNQQDVAR
jgi:hypothetical protein